LNKQKIIAIVVLTAIIILLLTFSIMFQKKAMVNQLSLLKTCNLTIKTSNSTYNTTVYEAITQAEQEARIHECIDCWRKC